MDKSEFILILPLSRESAPKAAYQSRAGGCVSPAFYSCYSNVRC